ncbi:MAG: lipopolysaccharide secretin LptD [Rhodobacteraceae bacterium HLUCCA12]|nr:MAG: lipopolysaccharide secretin LptD [Rhodobacteraceae bacterium HLUCCA12]
MRLRKMVTQWTRGAASAACLALCITLAPAAPAQAQTRATLMADQVYVDAAQRLVASGSVEVWHGSVRMTAERVIYDRAGDRLVIEGPIVLNDGPDRMFLADSAELSDGLRNGLIRSARVVLDRQLQIAAASVEREDERLTRMNAVVASSCPVCASNPTPLWEIRAARVTHDQQERQLYFDHAQFRVAGTPVFYLPHLRLPDPTLRRSRGFLTPRLSVRSGLGFGVVAPYFVPIGADRDLTLSPTLYSSGSIVLALRYRQAFANGALEIGGQVSRDRLLPDRARGYAYLRGLFHLRNDFRLEADLMAPSDRRYLDTYGITSDTRIRSHVTLERYRRDQAIRARAVHFYTLDRGVDNTTQPNRLVQAEWEQRIGLGRAGGDLRLRFAGQAFQRVSRSNGPAGRDVGQFSVEAQWRRQMILPGGLLAAGAVQGRLDHVRVGNDRAYSRPVNRGAIEGMVELRWPWAASGDAGASYVVEPIAQVIGSHRNRVRLPNEDHVMPELDPGNLFSFRRFTGFDAPDIGSRANLGLRWARIDPRGLSFEAMAGRIWRRGGYDVFARRNPQPLGQTRSNWLLAGRMWNDRGLSMGLRVLLDDARDPSRGEASVTWNGRATGLSTVYVYLPANRFEGRNTNSAEWYLNVSHQFANGVTARVGWEYDVTRSEFRTARTGLEYRADCVSVDLSLSHRFATSTNVNRSTSFGLQVELLGIGGARATPSGRACQT